MPNLTELEDKCAMGETLGNTVNKKCSKNKRKRPNKFLFLVHSEINVIPKREHP